MQQPKCRNGHESRVYVDSRGHRNCLTCRSEASARYRKRHVIRSADAYFGGNRERVIQRDGECCVQCGFTRAEHHERYGQDITVDHIDGKGKYTPKEERNNELTNLQTLCARCHGSKDGKRNWKTKRKEKG